MPQADVITNGALIITNFPLFLLIHYVFADTYDDSAIEDRLYDLMETTIDTDRSVNIHESYMQELIVTIPAYINELFLTNFLVLKNWINSYNLIFNQFENDIQRDIRSLINIYVFDIYACNETLFDVEDSFFTSSFSYLVDAQNHFSDNKIAIVSEVLPSHSEDVPTAPLLARDLFLEDTSSSEYTNFKDDDVEIGALITRLIPQNCFKLLDLDRSLSVSYDTNKSDYFKSPDLLTNAIDFLFDDITDNGIFSHAHCFSYLCEVILAYEDSVTEFGTSNDELGFYTDEDFTSEADAGLVDLLFDEIKDHLISEHLSEPFIITQNFFMSLVDTYSFSHNLNELLIFEYVKNSDVANDATSLISDAYLLYLTTYNNEHDLIVDTLPFSVPRDLLIFTL